MVWLNVSSEICQKRLCIVLGMHRSGTSALTRALSLLGAALPSRPMPPSADNEAGFWEPASIVAVHDEILASVGARWDEVAPFPSEWFASAVARSYAERLAALVVEEFGDAPLAVLKDPRLCRLMPLWRQVLELAGVRPLIVMAIRHPLEVAASLAARNGLSREHCLLLWLDHVLAAERDTRGLPRFVVHYDTLLDAPETTLRRVAQALDLPLPGTLDDTTPGVPSRRYRHHCADFDTSSAASTGGWVRAVYERLTESADLRPADQALFDAIRREHETAQRYYLPVIGDRIAALAARLAEAEAQASRQIQRVEHVRAQLEQANDELRRTVAFLQSANQRQTMAYCLRRLLRQCKDAMLSNGHERRLAALIRSSGLFDEIWYLGTYPDVADAAADPILHYLRFGAREGRRPNCRFDPDDYLRRHPEAASTGEIPFLHYASAAIAAGSTG